MEEIKNTNTVNLEELEFERIYKVLKYKDNEDNEKQITIYNLTETQEQKLLSILMKYADVENSEVKFNVPQTEVFSSIIPMMTNIEMPSNKESIDRIINNPNDMLKEVLLIITEKLTKIIKLNFKSLQLTKSTLEEMGFDDEKLLKMAELQTKQKELELQLEKEKANKKDVQPKPKRKYNKKKKVEDIAKEVKTE